MASNPPVVQAAVEDDRPAFNLVTEEIIVTARKRRERAIDTPVAMSALTKADVERYLTRDLADLTTRVPGLEITHAGGGSAGGDIAIRNVGTTGFDFGLERPVSLVMDGMSFSRGYILNTGFFDIAAVEVSKGPQALYFGKNSPAGVVGITSVSPKVGAELEGFVRASYEFRTQDPVLEAGLSLPLGDSWAFRLAVRRQDMQGGYFTNTAVPLDPNPTAIDDLPTRGAAYNKYPKQKQNVVRFTAVWEPVESFDATLKVFSSYSKQNDSYLPRSPYLCADGPGTHPYAGFGFFQDVNQTCPRKPRASLKVNAALPPAAIADGHPFVDADSHFYNKFETEIYTLEANWLVGDYSFTAVSGYWDYDHSEYTNFDSTNFAMPTARPSEVGQAFTQELRVRSQHDGSFNFMLGGFFETMKRTVDAPGQLLPQVFYPPGFMPNREPDAGPYFGSFINYHQHWDNKIRSYAVFGSFDWSFAERLSLAGGLRYSNEHREALGGNLYERGLGLSPAGVKYFVDGSSDNLSPELTLRWKPRRDLMTYVAYKTGYQSFGIANVALVRDLRSFSRARQEEALMFDESEVGGVEIGFKGLFFDGRLSAEFAAYHFDYDNLQIGFLDVETATNTIENAPGATNEGVELATTFQATQGLQLRLAAQYNVLEAKNWSDGPCSPTENAIPVEDLPSTGPACHLGPDGDRIKEISSFKYGGPPLQFNVGATYLKPFSANWSVEVNLDVNYHDKRVDGEDDSNFRLPAYTVANFSARVFQAEGPWGVALTCTNCTDERYLAALNGRIAGKVTTETLDMVARAGIPRLITLQFSYSFR